MLFHPIRDLITALLAGCLSFAAHAQLSAGGPSVSAKGTLYWCSCNRQGNQGMQGYYAAWLGDHYAEPKMVQVPGVSSVQDPFISADEKYLVFLSGVDLYITFRQGVGWGPALDYDQLEKENDNWCNGSDNILMIAIRLQQGT